MNQPSARATEVLLEFQAVMDQFLDLQRMMVPAYLGAEAQYRPAPHADPAPATPPLATVPTATVPPALSPRQTEVVSPVTPGVAELDTSSKASALVDLRPEPTCVRYRVAATDRPLPELRASLPRDHVVVVTDDGRGVAAQVSGRLRADGFRTAIIVTTPGGAEPAADALVAPVESLADAEDLVRTIVARFGPVAALVHLVPLRDAAPLDTLTPDGARNEFCRDTRSLFLMARALGAELESAVRHGGAAVIACTGMGGSLGHGSEAGPTANPAPLHGGVLGFTKCLALEWPEVRVRAVDLDPAQPVDVLAGHIVDELWAPDRAYEIGYGRDGRMTLHAVAADAVATQGFELPGDAVVLATGGARGITADVCLELAERYQPTFIIVGQSPLPEGVEPPDVADLTVPGDLKRALMTRLQGSSHRVNPAQVERAYRQLEKEREIKRNLGALTAAGARLHYVPLDVREPGAFGALIDDIYARYGRLDGVIHGAGVIEDRLVRDKSLESFERVFATKALSAVTLMRHLRPESLRFLVFFSSVAGRFGNRGQSDYAAANEVVSKLAVALGQRWPARICSIAWAPWDRRGMVSPELKREFSRRGVALVPPAAGRVACWMELQQAVTADAEIVIGGAVTAAAPGGAAAQAAFEPLPLLRHAQRENTASGTARYSRVLDVAVDRYLDDHRLDGRPVLPLAVATELMAEAAQATWPDLRVLAVRDLRLMKGITLDGGPLTVVLVVRAAVHSAADGVTEAEVDLTTPTLAPVVRYRAVVQLTRQLPDVESFEPPPVALTPLPMPLEQAYRELTFHGPLFQRVTHIAGLSGDALMGTIFSSTSVPVLSGVAHPLWIMDPFVFDAALQLILIWSRVTNGLTALPSRFAAFRCYGSLSDQSLTCHAVIMSAAGGHSLKVDIHFVDSAGRIVGLLQGIEASCSAALNRLATREGAPRQ